MYQFEATFLLKFDYKARIEHISRFAVIISDLNNLASKLQEDDFSSSPARNLSYFIAKKSSQKQTLETSPFPTTPAHFSSLKRFHKKSRLLSVLLSLEEQISPD